jgi:signal transduction histidine kinase
VVLVALVLLAVLGVRGIQRSRESAIENARAMARVAVEQASESFLQDWEQLRESARKVWELAMVPMPPGQVGEAEAAYLRSLKMQPKEADAALAKIQAEHPDAMTSSGLPLAPFIAWERLQRPENEADIPGRAETLARTAVEEKPSLVSGRLLEAAANWLKERGVAAEPLRIWQKRWREDEAIRNGLARASENSRAKERQWVELESDAWWIEADGEGVWRVTTKEQIEAAAHAANQRVSSILPKPAELVIAWAERPLLSHSAGERLAIHDHENLQVLATVRDVAELYREQRAQTYWLAALLAISLLGVLGGFLAMQRALHTERQLNQQKSDFVSSVSHELRTPVSSMRLMLENLEHDRVPGESARQEYLRLLGSECRRLSALIENVLDFARIENDRKVYAMGETDVASMLRDTIQMLQPQAAERRQKLTLKIEPMNEAPHLDALAMQQAVINLVENAMKFSPAETTIAVTAGPRDAVSWQLSVTDEGPGIAASEHARIFERFYRVGNELRRETQGAGIGLAIVQHTVHAHGGRIEVDSAPGRGSTFTLILPYHSEASPAIPAT